jgi:hypothetical protein
LFYVRVKDYSFYIPLIKPPTHKTIPLSDNPQNIITGSFIYLFILFFFFIIFFEGPSSSSFASNLPPLLPMGKKIESNFTFIISFFYNYFFLESVSFATSFPTPSTLDSVKTSLKNIKEFICLF